MCVCVCFSMPMYTCICCGLLTEFVSLLLFDVCSSGRVYEWSYV